MLKEKATSAMRNRQNQNLIIYGFGQAVNLISPLLVIPYVVSICGEEGLGKISIGFSLAFILIVVVDFGSYINGVKEIAVNRNNPLVMESVFITTYLTKFLLFLFIAAFSILLIFCLPFFYREKEVFLFSLLIVFAQFLNPVWFLQGIENFKMITTINVISKIIYVSSLFLFLKRHDSYYLANLFWGIGAIAANLVGLIWVMRKYGFSFRNMLLGDITVLVKRDATLCVSQLFLSMQQYAPIMIVGYFGGNFLAGQYKIVEQIMIIFKTYLYLFFNFVYPRVCYLVNDNIRAGLIFWKKYNGLNFLFLVILMGGVYFFSDRIVKFFHATDIPVTAALLRVAIFIPVVFAISIPLQQLMLGFNKQKRYILLTIVMVTVNLSAIAVVLPLFGLHGVFGVMLFTEALLVIIYYLNLRSKFVVADPEKPISYQGNS